MKIAILGFGAEGRSAFEYWDSVGNEITICDQNENLEIPKSTVSKLGSDYLENLAEFDVIMRSPGIHPKDILKANPDSPDILGKVTSVTNEFFKVCPTKNIIGVTGTKGKGTTSTLITKMLEACDKNVHLGGNIGIPKFDLLKGEIQPDDWVVLELSSFQLIDLKTSPHIAVCLMVEPEHLDWHVDLDEYLDAKQQLFMNQNEADIAIYYPENDNSVTIADASVGKQIPYFAEPGAIVENGAISISSKEICKTSELKLLGKHNWQNVCAAVTAVWQISQDVDAIRSALVNFSGLPFRIEFRTEKNGIRYYNDSFATGAGSARAAIEAIPEMKVLIIGGYDRGLQLTNLAEVIVAHQNSIRKIVLVGASAKRTSEALTQVGYTNFVFCDQKNMNQIVASASKEALEGDAVVLSPGFASFDMFKNFEERGVKFNQAVEAL